MRHFAIENNLYHDIMVAAQNHIMPELSKPILRGVYFEVEPGKVRITALNGYRMIHYVVKLKEKDLDTCSFIIPPLNLRKRKNNYIEIDYSDVESGIIRTIDKTENIVITQQVINGDYIGYRNIFSWTLDKPASIFVNPRYLIDALKASLAICNYEKDMVKITFDSGNDQNPIRISCIGSYGDVTSIVLPIKIRGHEEDFDDEI